MSDTLYPPSEGWTAADLLSHYGPIPLSRVLQNPAPGTATEADVLRLHESQKRLCELADGTLLEKTVGTYESWLAATLVRILGSFVANEGSGIVLGADGMLRLADGLVRIPDISFISFAKLPGGKIPRQPIADLVPNLAVEVISKGNTHQEMERKLGEYFSAGVQQVWYIYPDPKTVRVYSSPDNYQLITESETLTGGKVLPGFSLELSTYFAD